MEFAMIWDAVTLASAKQQKYNKFFTVSANMQPDPIFSILDSVDSTNNYAMGMVHAGMAKHGTCWFSRHQTAGKGQRSKNWVTEPGANITMSIVVNPSGYNLREAYLFNMAVSVACKNFFEYESGQEFKIKWPNDLYWRDRKAGGILIENVIRGNNWVWSVVGTGLNINQEAFDADLKNPVSLSQITGKKYEVVSLAKEIHRQILKALDRETNYYEDYNHALYKKGEQAKLKVHGKFIEGIISHVDTNGRLIVSADQPISFESGEVEWIS